MIHETTLVNGESTMRAHEPLRIAPGATVRFVPGGLHIMLHLKHPLAAGDNLDSGNFAARRNAERKSEGWPDLN